MFLLKIVSYNFLLFTPLNFFLYDFLLLTKFLELVEFRRWKACQNVK